MEMPEIGIERYKIKFLDLTPHQILYNDVGETCEIFQPLIEVVSLFVCAPNTHEIPSTDGLWLQKNTL